MTTPNLHLLENAITDWEDLIREQNRLQAQINTAGDRVRKLLMEVSHTNTVVLLPSGRAIKPFSTGGFSDVRVIK